MSVLTKRPMLDGNEKAHDPKKIKLSPLNNNNDDNGEEDDEVEGLDEDEDEDTARMYSTKEDPNEMGSNCWKLDDNEDNVQSFFLNNQVYGVKNWAKSKEFKEAIKIAKDIENALNGVVRKSAVDTKWFGFVIVPAFEAQEGQQAFEEALGLPEELIEAEAGIYFEDLEEDSTMFVQEEDELDDLPEDMITKMDAARDIIIENLSDLFTVGFCSDVESCLYPEFWGGTTDDGIIVGVVTTIHPTHEEDE